MTYTNITQIVKYKSSKINFTPAKWKLKVDNHRRFPPKDKISKTKQAINLIQCHCRMRLK